MSAHSARFRRRCCPMTFCRARLKQVVMTTRRRARSHRNEHPVDVVRLYSTDVRLDSLAVERLLDGPRVWRTGLLHVQSTHLAVTKALRPLLPLLALRARGGLNDWNVIGSSRMQWPSVRHENSVVGNARCLDGPRLNAPFSIAHHRARERTPKRRETWSEFNVRLG